MGTAAYAAFMGSITNKKFTATQYALLSSLMGVPRVLASAPTGFLAKHMGWENFFIFCVFIAHTRDAASSEIRALESQRCEKSVKRSVFFAVSVMEEDRGLLFPFSLHFVVHSCIFL